VLYLKDQGLRHEHHRRPALRWDGNGRPDPCLSNVAKALSETTQNYDGENLIQGFKRANNFLSQARMRIGVEYSFWRGPSSFAETEE